MQTNASEMSTPRPEMPNTESFSKEETESAKPGAIAVKEKRCIKKPSSIPTGQKNKAKANVGLRSAAAKTEPEDNHAFQRPTSKSRTMPSSIGNAPKLPRPTSSTTTNSQKRFLENQYLSKKKRYTILKKELTDKHKNAVELYQDITQLREKMIASGVKDPGKPEEIGLFLGSEPDKCLEPNIAAGAGEQIQLPDLAITSEYIVTMESKLQAIPNSYLTLCQEALKKRTEILTWLTDFGQDERGNEVTLDPAITKKIEAFRSDESNLIERLEITNKSQSELIQDLLQKSGDLWTECQLHRSKIKETGNTGGNQLKEKLKDLNEQLKTERERSQQLKERKTLLEGQLQKLRGKVKELETQVSNGESKINQLQSTVKQLESQVKQKEASLEQRTKEMQKIAKSNETVISKLEKQKENIESRLNEMTNELFTKGNVEGAAQKSRQKLQAVTKELSQEKEMRLQVEASLAELKERYAVLEEKSQELLELADKAKGYSKSDSSVSNHSNNELRLYNELQAAKATIESQEERIDQLHREREEFVAVMKRAANREEGHDTNSKLAADLLSATHELKALKEENSLLKNNFKVTHNKSETLERQLTELHARLQVQSKEGGKAGWNALVIELQQQNSDLKCNLNELARQNQQLEAELSQKQVELDCIKHNQNKLLRAKEEIKNYIRPSKVNGEMDEVDGAGRDLDQVDRQIAAKAEELQEIFTTLEGKQMQVMQLEKMVKQMEEQQDRAQAQRTRLETRIAQLEIAAKEKNHRYVKGRSVPFLNSQRNDAPPALLQPTAPPILQELRFFPQGISPRYTIPKPTMNRSKNWDSLKVKLPRVEIFARDVSSSPRERSGHIKRLEGGGYSGSPRSLRAVSPGEALAYEMRESLYDWLMKPSKSPRKPEQDYERSSGAVSSLKVEKPRKGCTEGRRRQNQSSRESIFRGYKKRSFRSHRPMCDYQSPRKPAPTIRVRRYTA